MDYAPAYNENFGQLGFEVSQRWPERERIAAKGKTRDTLGLALSGGGYRSALAADNLRQMGYRRVTSMDGGWRGWNEAGYPITRD